MVLAVAARGAQMAEKREMGSGGSRGVVHSMQCCVSERVVQSTACFVASLFHFLLGWLVNQVSQDVQEK